MMYSYGGRRAWNKSQKISYVTQLKKKSLFGEEESAWWNEKELRDDFGETGIIFVF